jgi:DNA-directed RNA polymerase subunit RPC12/RpoP
MSNPYSEPEPTMTLFYRCPSCSEEWQDEWDCEVDDECPACGLRHIEPYDAEDL